MRAAGLYGDHVQEPFVEEGRRGMKPTFKALILWHIVVLFLQLCQSLCSGETTTASGSVLVDLSHEFNEDTIYWVTTKPLFVNVTHNGTVESKGHWYQSEEMSAGTHGGTHLDAPCHFALGRWCTSDIPLDRLVAPVIVVDISNDVQDNSSVHLQTSHLTAWEESHGKIPEGSVVLIRTGWARFYPDRLTYTGTTEKNPDLLNYPSIQPESAKWLADNRQIFGIGIDTMSLDAARSKPLSHIYFEEKNIYGLENVNDNLRLLPPTGATIYVMPMKLKGTSGAPCRVVALLPKDDRSGAVCSSATCSATVTVLAVVAVYLVWSKSN